MHVSIVLYRSKRLQPPRRGVSTGARSALVRGMGASHQQANFSVLSGSKKLKNGHLCTTGHCLPLLSRIRYNYKCFSLLPTTEKNSILPNLYKRKTLQSIEDYNIWWLTRPFWVWRRLRFWSRAWLEHCGAELQKRIHEFCKNVITLPHHVRLHESLYDTTAWRGKESKYTPLGNDYGCRDWNKRKAIVPLSGSDSIETDQLWRSIIRLTITSPTLFPL